MKIVVVGGGTSGCISALAFKQKFPSIDITMIRSKEIGILGPGEGLAPSMNSFLKDLNISIEDFINNTGATIKHGVMFNNWDKNGSSWFHSFNDFYGNSINKDVFLKNYKTSINLKNNINDLDYLYHVAKNKNINLENKAQYGFHIDARKLVIFLEKVAIERGIAIVDDKVIDFICDDFDNITSIITQNKNIFDCDFVVDCSGFEKLFIGKHYKAEWESMSDLLPATDALACFLPADENFYPYTEATALKYGWSWKIPLQHRYGCGYVYDGNYISKKEAELELIELYGDKIEIVNNFKYSPGFFKTPWIKNCFGNGLSTSFFEPIEATTISAMINYMYYFLIYFFPKYIKQTLLSKNIDSIQDIFNNNFVETQKGIAAFLHMHYRTNRTDTDFWKNFSNKYPIPEWENINLKQFINNVNSNNLDEKMFKISNWQEYSWMALYAGNMMHENFVSVDKSDIEEYNKSINIAKDESLKYTTDHLNFLKKIKDNKGEII